MIDSIFQQVHDISDSRLYLIALVLMIARLRRVASVNRFLLGFINLFGTFFHELAHYVIGLILYAKPTGFSIWPKAQAGGGFVLGSVSFGNLRFFNTLPTAIAPLLLIILAYYVDIHFFATFDETIATYILYIFTIVILLENSIPSTTDIRVAFNNGGGILLYVGGGAVFFFHDQIETWLSQWLDLPW
jgi:hypothetical protein